MRQNSSLAHIQLRSPSPSEMDPTDAHDDDRQLSGTTESPLKRARLHSSPARETASAPEYPSPPQRPHSGSTEHGGIEKAFGEVSAPLLSKNKFHLDKDSRNPSSSPPVDSPRSPVSRPSLNSHFNTIIMHTGTKSRKSLPAARNTEARRPARMPYTAEQDDFIRFVRDDLSLSWEISAQFYNDVRRSLLPLFWPRPLI
ncbi:hypothetical protein EX30DRAFT_138740 [Ascodesmis nigricans]|uniref:Uncharacterized protein n=1 Tax=Ascodesmis nigricans TaxID=341454 RepID=A0A4S2N170_9PEZI|nr:hypothetical protein EX30DRAFT_138740 [Ascodesmis nigricans]